MNERWRLGIRVVYMEGDFGGCVYWREALTALLEVNSLAPLQFSFPAVFFSNFPINVISL